MEICGVCGKEVDFVFETDTGIKICEKCAESYEMCEKCDRIITGEDREGEHGYICHDCWIGLIDKTYETWVQDQWK